MRIKEDGRNKELWDQGWGLNDLLRMWAEVKRYALDVDESCGVGGGTSRVNNIRKVLQ